MVKVLYKHCIQCYAVVLYFSANCYKAIILLADKLSRVKNCLFERGERCSLYIQVFI